MTNTDLILSDAPIAEKNADTLNRKYFVENLKNVISAHPLDEQSVRICVDAKWGEGKTSVFNLLKEELKEENEKNKGNIKYICIDFNPWYYNNEEAGLKSLLKLLGKAISYQKPYPDANGEIDKLIKVILGVCNKFLGVDIVSLLETNKDIQESLKSISESAKKTKKKYVIFIDDLDRLDAPAIKNILKMIMIMSEIKGLIFVIAASIENICVNEKIISKEYIEKIMTLVLPLPTVDQTKIRNYFFKEFEKIIEGKKFSQKGNKTVKKRLEGDFLKLKRICNLRNIKRLLEAFKILYKPLEKEVDVVDFLLIVYLHIFYPKIVKEIYDNRHKLNLTLEPRDAIENMQKVQELLNNKNSNKDDFFKELANLYQRQEDKEELETILSTMFGYRFSEHPKSIDDKRYFYKYFLFYVYEKEIPDKLIEEHVRKWKENASPKLEDDIHKTFLGWQNDYKYDISSFFEKFTNKNMQHEKISKNLIDRSAVPSYINTTDTELLKTIIRTIDKVETPFFLTVESISDLITNNFCDDEDFLKDILQNGKNLSYYFILAIRLDKYNGTNYEEMFFKRLSKITKEQRLKSGNWRGHDLIKNTFLMIDSYIEWQEKLKEDREKINEIFKTEYLPIILVDKRLILSLMYEYVHHDLHLLNYWREGNIDKAISFLEKQELSEDENQILEDFKEKNEEDPQKHY